MDSIRNARDKALEAIDAGFKTTVKGISSAAQFTTEQAGAAKERVDTFLETGAAHWAVGEAIGLEYVREGVQWVSHNKELAYVGAGAAAVVLLPGPRRFVIRKLLQPFRSEEAMYRSAERRMEKLKGNVDLLNKESQKLEERMTAAVAEFNSGRQKLKDTSRQLSRLSSQIQREMNSAQGLLRDLRHLPSKPALAMRSTVATQLAGLKNRNKQIDGNIYSIMKKGI